MDGKWGPALPEGETLLWEGGLHWTTLGLPALFLVLGIWQWTPWGFAGPLAGLLAMGIGLLSGWAFYG